MNIHLPKPYVSIKLIPLTFLEISINLTWDRSVVIKAKRGGINRSFVLNKFVFRYCLAVRAKRDTHAHLTHNTPATVLDLLT